ncbi:MAG: hypothetical protein ACYTBJ_21825 [Planctomycetota bacterium]|jgi:hypothetical protein
MKSLNRIVAVLAVFTLAMAVFAVPEEPAETEDVELVEQLEQVVIEESAEADEDEMAAAEEQMKAAEEEMQQARLRMDEAARRMEKFTQRSVQAQEREALLRDRQRRLLLRSTPIQFQSGPLTIDTASGRGAGRVLVIPDEDIGTGQLLATMEDMNIMSRIIDKKLGQSQLGQEHTAHFYMTSVLDRSASEIRSIYLDGYGALFLSKVDFPLSPGPRAGEEESADGYDPLWAQTRQEMYRVPEGYQPWNSKERVQEYDAEKVEELKRKLIRALRHAANIRGLDGGDWIVISITGSGSRSQATTVIRSSIDKDGKVVTKTEKRATTPSESYSTTVLTIRASKSDVDEFAEGDSDFDEFRERVQIFTY